MQAEALLVVRGEEKGGEERSTGRKRGERGKGGAEGHTKVQLEGRS